MVMGDLSDMVEVAFLDSTFYFRLTLVAMLLVICAFVFSGADYHRKRHREDDRRGPEISKRNFDHESRRNADHESRPVKIVFFIFLSLF